MKRRRRRTETKAGTANRAKSPIKPRTGRLKKLETKPTLKAGKRRLRGAAKAFGQRTDKAAERTLSILKRFGLETRLKEHNTHLQGLYAELGKSIYELYWKEPRAASKRSHDVAELFFKITEMRRKKSRLEQEAGNPTRAA
jgi:hypothetical protein